MWGRSGSIQAALNLEIPPEKVAYYNIKIEGLNGQLPNLDLVNLVVRLCGREGAAIRLHNQVTKKYKGHSENKSYRRECFL